MSSLTSFIFTVQQLNDLGFVRKELTDKKTYWFYLRFLRSDSSDEDIQLQINSEGSVSLFIGDEYTAIKMEILTIEHLKNLISTLEKPYKRKIVRRISEALIATNFN